MNKVLSISDVTIQLIEFCGSRELYLALMMMRQGYCPRELITTQQKFGGGEGDRLFNKLKGFLMLNIIISIVLTRNYVEQLYFPIMKGIDN